MIKLQELQALDVLRKCPKCGHDKINSQYYPANKEGKYSGPEWVDYKIRDQERIDRYCLRCSYIWCVFCIADDLWQDIEMPDTEFAIYRTVDSRLYVYPIPLLT